MECLKDLLLSIRDLSKLVLVPARIMNRCKRFQLPQEQRHTVFCCELRLTHAFPYHCEKEE